MAGIALAGGGWTKRRRPNVLGFVRPRPLALATSIMYARFTAQHTPYISASTKTTPHNVTQRNITLSVRPAVLPSSRPTILRSYHSAVLPFCRPSFSTNSVLLLLLRYVTLRSSILYSRSKHVLVLPFLSNSSTHCLQLN